MIENDITQVLMKKYSKSIIMGLILLLLNSDEGINSDREEHDDECWAVEVNRSKC